MASQIANIQTNMNRDCLGPWVIICVLISWYQAKEHGFSLREIHTFKINILDVWLVLKVMVIGYFQGCIRVIARSDRPLCLLEEINNWLYVVKEELLIWNCLWIKKDGKRFFNFLWLDYSQKQNQCRPKRLDSLFAAWLSLQCHSCVKRFRLWREWLPWLGWTIDPRIDPGLYCGNNASLGDVFGRVNI